MAKLGTYSTYTQAQAQALELTDLSQDAYWFVRSYQPFTFESEENIEKTVRHGYVFVTLADVVTAIENAAVLTQQFPIVPKLVTAIGQSLFVNGEPLLRAPEAGIIESENGAVPYLTGGRHRFEAIKEYIELVTNLLPEVSQKERESIIENTIGNTLIAVRETVVPDEVTIVKLIFADNHSRSMTAVEKVHIEAQAEYGIKPGVYDAKVVTNVLAGDLSKAQKQQLLMLQFYYLAKKSLPKTLVLKENTLKVIGTTLAKYILAEENISKNGQTIQAVFKAFLTDLESYVANLDENLPADFEFRTNVARHAAYITTAIIGDDESEGSLADRAAGGEFLKKATTTKKSTKTTTKAVAKTEEI